MEENLQNPGPVPAGWKAPPMQLPHTYASKERGVRGHTEGEAISLTLEDWAASSGAHSPLSGEGQNLWG